MWYLAITGMSIFVVNLLMTVIVVAVKRTPIHILWSITSFCIALFGLWFYIQSIAQSPELWLLWWKIGYIWVVNIPVIMFHATLYLTKNFSVRQTRILILSYIAAFFLNIINLSDLLIEQVAQIYPNEWYYIPFWYTFSYQYYGCFMLYFKVVTAYLLYILYTTYNTTKSIELKKQCFFFGTWVTVGFIGGESCFFPTYGFHTYPTLSILIGVFPFVILYGILHHHLFDAKSAILKIFRHILILSITAFVMLWIWFSVPKFTEYIPRFHPIETGIWILGWIVAILLYTSQGLSKFFQLSSLNALERETEIFLSRKSVYDDTIQLLEDIEIFFERGLKIHRVSILNKSIAKKYPYANQYFRTYRRPLILSELEAEDIEGESEELVEEVRTMGRTIFPIEIGREHDMLFLVIGAKESEEHMTDREIMMILRILPKIAMSLQILEFNHALQAEVRKKTKSLDQKNKELRDAYEKLQEIDHNKDNFLAIASHELRTPMTIVKWYADLFLQNTLGTMNEQQQHYMKKIFDSTEWLIDLVNNILDISKIEAGRMELNITKVSLSSVFSGVYESFIGMYEEKWITLNLTNTLSFDILQTDEAKFRLVLTNLLSNAYKFTPAPGQVEIVVSQQERMLSVSVHDTGVGVSPEMLPHIFEKFNQGSNHTDYTKKSIKGTGLGLNLSKQLIDMLGGDITATSEEGKWTTFTFTLPLSNYDLQKQ